MFDDLEAEIKPYKERVHTEYKLHIAILKHINSAFIGAHNPNLKCFHIPNETKDATDAFFKKEMGVLPGVLDFCLGWPIKNTGFLEVKPPDKPLSSSQNKFISWASLIGWQTGVARSVKESHNVLCSWGLKPSHNSIIESDYATEAEKFQRVHDMYKRP